MNRSQLRMRVIDNATANSTHSKVHVLYTRRDKNLSFASGRGARVLREEWDYFYQEVSMLNSPDLQVSDEDFPDPKTESITIKQELYTEFCRVLPNKAIKPSSIKLTFHEIQLSGEDQHRGIITTGYLERFDKWMISLILNSAKLWFLECPIINSESMITTKEITDLFETELRNIAKDDKWNEGGREFFEKKIDFFVSRNLQIECCLPAFPCKSSNKNKVRGTLPDQGELLALGNLREFALRVRSIYKPGLKMVIVSDGHVFSDLIGVNDTQVDEYALQLRVLGERLGEFKNFVTFFALPDLFFSVNQKIHFDERTISKVIIEDFLTPQRTESAEMSRKMLLRSCETDVALLNKEIRDSSNPKQALHRGFSKFMFEDLVRHPIFQNLSAKKKRGLSANIGFEMIRRNEAYSNLVEILLPAHVRLSIHCHNNLGPKFGIQLLSPKQCRPFSEIEGGQAPQTGDLLHIPTPWHNCVAEVEGYKHFFIGGSAQMEKLCISGTEKLKGSWLDGNARNDNKNGLYVYIVEEILQSSDHYT